ncbi:DUF1127 domain-containing protein [Falsiroseomonas sp. HW251]|uniref:DUF1127 domain-containing protein n=1 Tax=Falsiroseomonas sp. HW251 TaxID=3390998 RepID=UPI003D318DFA
MRIPAFIHLPIDLPAPAAPAIPRRALRALIAWTRGWLEERRTLALVAQMDQATLRDLGLNRYELEAHLRSGQVRTEAFLRGWRGL